MTNCRICGWKMWIKAINWIKKNKKWMLYGKLVILESICSRLHLKPLVSENVEVFIVSYFEVGSLILTLVIRFEFEVVWQWWKKAKALYIGCFHIGRLVNWVAWYCAVATLHCEACMILFYFSVDTSGACFYFAIFLEKDFIKDL